MLGAEAQGHHIAAILRGAAEVCGSVTGQDDEFINYLKYNHFQQSLLCMVNHGVRNAEGVLLTAIGLSSVLLVDMSITIYLTFKQQLSLLNQG